MAKPQYKAKRKSYVIDKLVQKHEIFEYDGIPSRHWIPMNEEAEKKSAALKKPKKLSVFQANEAKKEEAAAKKEESGSAENNNPETVLSEAERLKLISQKLQELDHGKDEHWTKGGEPDLNVMKEKLGFYISRGELKEIAGGFARQS